MIMLILLFIFQIFFGEVLPYVPDISNSMSLVGDVQTNLFASDAVIKNATIEFSALKPPVRFDAQVAHTPAQRARGLMYKNFLGKNKGMLFVFDDDAPRNFWMKNTLIPLDMIFADETGTVVSVSENVRPCAEVLRVTKAGVCPSYSSVFPARYVLEINAGLAQAHHIQAGSRMDIRI